MAPSSRPLSPHLSIYRFTLTMTMSIVHRATGIALYGGTLLLVLFGYTWVLFHHMLGGVRHFIWDMTKAMDPAGRELIVRIQLGTSIPLTLIVWAIFVWFK